MMDLPVSVVESMNNSMSTSPSSPLESCKNPNVKKVGYCFIIFENIDSVTNAALTTQHYINGYVVEAKVCDKSVSRKTPMQVGGKLIPAKEDTAKYRCYNIHEKAQMMPINQMGRTRGLSQNSNHQVRHQNVHQGSNNFNQQISSQNQILKFHTHNAINSYNRIYGQVHAQNQGQNQNQGQGNFDRQIQ